METLPQEALRRLADSALEERMRREEARIFHVLYQISEAAVEQRPLTEHLQHCYA
jgi:hypothetical protein